MSTPAMQRFHAGGLGSVSEERAGTEADSGGDCESGERMTNEDPDLMCLACNAKIKVPDDYFDVPVRAPRGLSFRAGLHWDCLYKIGARYVRAEVERRQGKKKAEGR